MFRVSGKLTGGKTFALRLDADNAVDAASAGVRKLTATAITEGGPKVSPSDVTEIHVSAMQESEGVHIGTAKARKPRARRGAAK